MQNSIHRPKPYRDTHARPVLIPHPGFQIMDFSKSAIAQGLFSLSMAMSKNAATQPDGTGSMTQTKFQKPPAMIRKILIAPVLVACLGASSHAALFISAADMTGNTAKTFSPVGVRFGVEANDIPAGQSVQVSHLGFFAGIAGQFTGAGIMDDPQTVSLYGPRDWSSRAGDYSGLNVASVTVPAGNPVDDNGWSWVALTNPLTLVGGQYYTLVTTTSALDGYFDPYEGPGGTASIIAPGSIFRNGTGDTYMKGRWGLGNGQEAYDASGYLAANFQYQIIPEPTAALLALLSLPAVLRRRR